MNMQAIDKVLESLGDYSERGDEYRAKCPSHQGESDDSLAVREDDDGKVLLHCHTGCDFEEIVDALGLDMSDLFSENGQASGAGKPVGPPPKEDRVAGTLSVEDLPGDSSEYMVFEKEDGTPYYIQRHKGAVYRVVGFDEDGNPILAAGLGDIEPILFGLPILREAIATGKPVIHTEGCKDALTAQRQLGMAGVTSGSCTSWKSEFVQDYEGAEEVWIVPDNDDEGRAYAQQIAQDLAGVVPTIKIVDLPGLPEKGDLTDWMDAGHTKEELLELVATAPALDSSQAWPEKPVALDIQLPAVEELRESLIPGPLSKWVFDVAKRMDNAAPDFVAAAAVVQAGALLGRKVGIRPKRHDDWVVIPNLWGGLVGMPASMKTPALEAALKPIKRLAAKAKELTLDKGSADDLKAFKKEFEELEEPEAPIQRRYVTNDTTIEKLAEILAENPDGILYYADELMRFLRGLDRVGREADRAFYLEAWNGSGSFEVDGIGRGSIFVPALCVSLLGGIQPGPLSKYVIDAMEDTDKADGLLQRFQVMVYPDLRSNPTDIIPEAKARNKAYEVFEKLANLDAGEFGAAASPDDVPTIGFSEEAQEIFNQWRAEFEPRYGSKDQSVAIQSHMLKFRSLFASIALIFEAIAFVGGSSSGGSVSKISAMRAAGWCEYLESHTLRVYSPLMDTPERRAELLLHKILIKEIKPGAKVREIYRKQWSGLKTHESVVEALAILSHHGWVRVAKVNPAGRGRPTEVLQVHPELQD